MLVKFRLLPTEIIQATRNSCQDVELKSLRTFPLQFLRHQNIQQTMKTKISCDSHKTVQKLIRLKLENLEMKNWPENAKEAIFIMEALVQLKPRLREHA